MACQSVRQVTLSPSPLSAGLDPAVTPGGVGGEVPDGVSACLKGLKEERKKGACPQMVGEMGGWGRRPVGGKHP